MIPHLRKSHLPSKPPLLEWNIPHFRSKPLHGSAPPSELIIVAIDASKQISNHAIQWALTNAAQEGDCITLLALIPMASGWKFWAHLGKECTKGRSGRSGSVGGRADDIEARANERCLEMLKQMQSRCEAKKVKVKLKVVAATSKGTTAVQAGKLFASWVILDRSLKKEEKYCMEHLHCNVVIVSSDQAPKILRLNFRKEAPAAKEPEEPDQSSSILLEGLSFSNIPQGFKNDGRTSPDSGKPTSEKANHFVGSPETGVSSTTSAPFTASTEYATSQSSLSSSDQSVPRFSRKPDGSNRADHNSTRTRQLDNKTVNPSKSYVLSSQRQVGQDSNKSGPGDDPHIPYAIPARMVMPISGDMDPFCDSERLDESAEALKASVLSMKDGPGTNPDSEPLPLKLLNHLLNSPLDHRRAEQSQRATVVHDNPTYVQTSEFATNKSNIIAVGDHQQHTSNIRNEISFPNRNPTASSAPPLCSICQHRSPKFGTPAIKFSYAELQKATNGFAEENFLAEGGFGSVHKGMLGGGQKIAVKQLRMASAQGDKEFCSEVEVLACAQHRNVVLLIGYCIEDGRRLLVYEYVCNGSLDTQLFNRSNPALEWRWRQKVAVGAARGLRFLHEDCRVGCIVHRDLRPNNILLTHDFEPLLGDFGLARCQADGELEEETRVLGTFGYLAPEYAQTGQLTEKADVYSFGVILLELLTARKAIDYSRPKGQQCLTEWARPLMEDHAAYELIDSRLENRYSEYEAYCMLHAASLCIRRDPHARPRMAQVLKILEGDMQGGSPRSFRNCYSAATSGNKSPTDDQAASNGYMSDVPAFIVSRNPLLLSSNRVVAISDNGTTTRPATTSSSSQFLHKSRRVIRSGESLGAGILNRHHLPTANLHHPPTNLQSRRTSTIGNIHSCTANLPPLK